MKKVLVIALAVIMVVAAVSVLAACGKEQTVEGEYTYKYSDTLSYGVKVKVTVKGDVIKKVEVTSTDTATYTNLSPNWTTDYTVGGENTEGRQAWIDKHEDFIASFAGMSVSDINKIKVATDTETNPDAHTVQGQPKAGGITVVPDGLQVVAKATQSSGRLILAVQNALSKLK